MNEINFFNDFDLRTEKVLRVFAIEWKNTENC